MTRENSVRMAKLLVLSFALCLGMSGTAAGQADSTAPRSATERPNMSAAGMQQTLSGVLMNAACSAIADSRSELTRTPRILPPGGTPASLPPSTERRSTERSRSGSVAEESIPERLRSCKLQPSTTSFALYSNGKVLMLDRLSNQMMQEHIAKRNPGTSDTNARWVTATLTGTTTSDDVLTLRSIKLIGEK